MFATSPLWIPCRAIPPCRTPPAQPAGAGRARAGLRQPYAHLRPAFAPSPHWRRTPPHADVAAYRRLQARLGTARAVVVTPSTYGTDNACTLDALDQLGNCARGVAVVGHEVAEHELTACTRAVSAACG